MMQSFQSSRPPRPTGLRIRVRVLRADGEPGRLVVAAPFARMHPISEAPAGTGDRPPPSLNDAAMCHHARQISARIEPPHADRAAITAGRRLAFGPNEFMINAVAGEGAALVLTCTRTKGEF